MSRHHRIGGQIVAVFGLGLSLLCAPASAFEFPGPTPGPAQGSQTSSVWRLENRVVRGQWTFTNGPHPVLFLNQLTGQAWPQAGSELFRIGFDPVQARRHAAIRLGTNTVEVLVSRTGTNWQTVATLNRADFPGAPSLLKLSKLGLASTNADSWPPGPLGDCWLEGGAILDAEGQPLAPADVSVVPGEWTPLLSSEPATVVTGTNSRCLIHARANVHAMLTRSLPPETAWVACGLGRGMDQGTTWSPGLALEQPDGNFLHISFLKAPDRFVILQPLGDYTVQAPGISAPVTVAASEFQIIEGPFLRPVTPRPESSRTSDHLPGLELFAALRHPATGLEVDWRAVLREGASYLRQTLAIRSTNLVGQITRVQMLDLSRVPVVTL